VSDSHVLEKIYAYKGLISVLLDAGTNVLDIKEKIQLFYPMAQGREELREKNLFLFIPSQIGLKFNAMFKLADSAPWFIYTLVRLIIDDRDPFAVERSVQILGLYFLRWQVQI
jgi:hypothetical protein